MIYQIDIHTDRANYIVHLEGESDFFWIIPIQNDGSEKWAKVQEWLDSGNKVTDTIGYKTMYQGERALAYPSIEEQLDMQYWDSVNGTTVWQDIIKSVKDNNPKPTE